MTPAEQALLPCPFKLPVEVDTMDCEDGRSRYQGYKIVDADGKSICDTINSDLQCVHTEYDEDNVIHWDEEGRKNMEFIAQAINKYHRVAFKTCPVTNLPCGDKYHCSTGSPHILAECRLELAHRLPSIKNWRAAIARFLGTPEVPVGSATPDLIEKWAREAAALEEKLS